MSRAADVPAEHTVDRALERYLAECRDNGRRPSVLGLAANLRISDTSSAPTSPIRSGRSQESVASQTRIPATSRTGPSPYERLTARNAKLRRANQILTQNLHLAAAQVQRLSWTTPASAENSQNTASVTSIDQARRGPSH